MPGLITLLWRHFAVLTNFSIYSMKSRPYWPERAYLSARSHGCAEGARQAPGVPMVDAETLVMQVVGPGNTNVAGYGWVAG